MTLLKKEDKQLVKAVDAGMAKIKKSLKPFIQGHNSFVETKSREVGVTVTIVINDYVIERFVNGNIDQYVQNNDMKTALRFKWIRAQSEQTQRIGMDFY